MKKLLLILLCLPMIGLGQDFEEFNNYKYIVINEIQHDEFELAHTVKSHLEELGFKVLFPDDNYLACYALFCQITPDLAASHLPQYLNISFIDCNNNIIAKFRAGDFWGMTIGKCLRTSAGKIFNRFRSFRYNYNTDIKSNFLAVEQTEQTGETDSSLTAYFDSNILHDIEGIYKSLDGAYIFGIKKFGKLFKAIIIESEYNYWRVGEVKIILNQTAMKGLYSCSYFLANKQKTDIFLRVENSGLLTFKISDKNEAQFIKMYPINTGVRNDGSNGEWSGNGSGFFISQDGYIVTNHHVIEKASEIEVEFKYRNEIKGFNARVIKTDETNDLAIIKIDDDKFSKISSLPYNLKTRTVDVGTEVFALGYPMALTIMGKEIKYTPGSISSKTGFKGNITTYQSTTPIQPGNSGGPLFDKKGNLIGINSAIIKTDVAENVSYTIKSSYLLSLIDVLPETIPLPSSTQLASKPLTEQIKILSDYVVLIKVK